MFGESSKAMTVGGKTDLAGVTAYIPKEWKAELEKWAEEEDRSISWLLAKMIEESLEIRRKEKK
ncbi:MAG: ribbon-helix-helix domain-containing protein [Actinomycetota bacterium]